MCIRDRFLIKTSTSHAMFTAPAGGLSVAALITNYPLWAGLACYGASTVLLILALRDGELSLLYQMCIRDSSCTVSCA